MEGLRKKRQRVPLGGGGEVCACVKSALGDPFHHFKILSVL